MVRQFALVAAAALIATANPSLSSAQSEDTTADATPMASESADEESEEEESEDREAISTPAAPETISGTGAAPVLMGELQLSLANAIAMGLENNLDVEIARHEPLSADYDTSIAWGAYDPKIRSETGYRLDREPGQSALAATQKVVDGVFGIGGQIPWIGASVDLTWTGNRTRSDRLFVSQNPTWSSRADLTGTLPLLKGLIWNQAWTSVKTSHVLENSAQARFESAVMTTVAQIESKYWELVANSEQERVAVKSLEAARALLDQVETRYEVGVVSKVDVVEAEAGVAEREVNLIRQSNLRARSQDEIIDLVLGPYLTAASELRVVPTDRPERFTKYAIDVETAAANAFKKRPELAQARLEVERQQLQLKFAKNQRLPQLDFEGRYTVGGERGIGGAQDPMFNPTPVTNGRGIEDSFNDYFTDAGRKGYSFRGVFSVPLGNVAGRATVGKTRLDLSRAERQLEKTRQGIILEVRNGTRDLRSAQQGINAADRRQAAAVEQLRAEKIRLEHGESTPFDVLQRESSLVEAESQRIGAYQLYRTSITQLERAQGTILESRNIVIDQVTALR